MASINNNPSSACTSTPIHDIALERSIDIAHRQFAAILFMRKLFTFLTKEKKETLHD